MFVIAVKLCHTGSYSPVTHVVNMIGSLNTGKSMNAICVRNVMCTALITSSGLNKGRDRGQI